MSGQSIVLQVEPPTTPDERIGKYIVHPVAAMFPLLTGPVYENFKGAVEAHGLIEPIVVQGDILIDGRNRLRACLDLDIEPQVREYDSPLEIPRYIILKNIQRRDLTPDQRISIAAKANAWAKTERARLKQLTGKSEDGAAGGRGRKKNLTQASEQGLPDRNARSTAGQIAKEAEVSRHKAEQAIAVAKEAPEELDAVIAGTQPLRVAAKKAKAKKPRPPRKPESYLDDVTRWVSTTRRLFNKYPSKHGDIALRFHRLSNEVSK